jgi:hypothetical protein
LEAHAVHVARAHMEHAAALRGAAEGLRHLGLCTLPACNPAHPPVVPVVPVVQATPTESPADGAKSLMERSLAAWARFEDARMREPRKLEELDEPSRRVVRTAGFRKTRDLIRAMRAKARAGTSGTAVDAAGTCADTAGTGDAAGTAVDAAGACADADGACADASGSGDVGTCADASGTGADAAGTGAEAAPVAAPPAAAPRRPKRKAVALAADGG